jgi:hippurate hydrolase
MAAGDRVFVKILGVGGHAARPHLAADPLVAAAAIVTSLQTVVARNVDPAETAVVTVGRLRTGDALNVIPEMAEIGISVRSFSPDVRALL